MEIEFHYLVAKKQSASHQCLQVSIHINNIHDFNIHKYQIFKNILYGFFCTSIFLALVERGSFKYLENSQPCWNYKTMP